MVLLGEANSRLKDFYDLYTLSRTQVFEAEVLEQSLRDTFSRRGTHWSEAAAFFDLTLSNLDAFTGGWSRLRRVNSQLALPNTFSEALEALKALLEPLVLGQVSGATWNPEGEGWQKPS